MSKYQPLLFYVSHPDSCGYLPGREAINLFADPNARMDTRLYGRLVDHGFRRSGRHVYRPHCGQCKSCVPTRILVEGFTPNRSQRRNRKINQDLTIKSLSAIFRQEHFDLYELYQNQRHPGGGMDNPRKEDYLNFLCCGWTDTRFVEFRLAGRLVGLAVTDILPQGLSAVYTFFDSKLRTRGIGTFAILWQIQEARRRKLPYVYLGYWIKNHSKMNYKTRFRPIELFKDGKWSKPTDS